MRPKQEIDEARQTRAPLRVKSSASEIGPFHTIHPVSFLHSLVKDYHWFSKQTSLSAHMQAFRSATRSGSAIARQSSLRTGTQRRWESAESVRHIHPLFVTSWARQAKLSLDVQKGGGQGGSVAIGKPLAYGTLFLFGAYGQPSLRLLSDCSLLTKRLESSRSANDLAQECRV